jgi:predicted metal-dependent HD superfamily phosphohydrolase
VDLHSRWEIVWRSLGRAPAADLFGRLLAAYREPHRRYHTLRHLDECFTQLQSIGSLAEHPVEVELALWFHDAVYDTRRQDNEERSAQWAAQALAPVSSEAANRVHDLVLATRHAAQPQGTDARIVVDIDLSILGAPEARFDEYEAEVREEYAWVPEPVYRRERRRILAGFLARESLFNTATFVERYEAQARRNLERALARL